MRRRLVELPQLILKQIYIFFLGIFEIKIIILTPHILMKSLNWT